MENVSVSLNPPLGGIKIYSTECINYLGAKDKDGYGWQRKHGQEIHGNE